MKAAMILGALALVAATGPASTWAGHYTAREPHRFGPNHADSTLAITPVAGGRMKVAFDVASPSCLGDVSFVTRRTTAPRLYLMKKSPVTGDLCEVKLYRDRGHILVSEDGCEGEHGFQCGFAGVYRPR